jgi:hypothetical protein
MKNLMIALWTLGGFAAVAGCSRDEGGGRGEGKVTAAGESIGDSECDD